MMKKLLIVLLLLALTFVGFFMMLGYQSKSGQAAGLFEGKLTRCPDKPNCVTSQHKNDPDHFIEPIASSPNTTKAAIKRSIIAMGGSIETEAETYLAATFTSSLFGFVDDFEVSVDTDLKVVHIRSASRVGHGDLGVNKKRAELLKATLLNNID